MKKIFTLLLCGALLLGLVISSASGIVAIFEQISQENSYSQNNEVNGTVDQSMKLTLKYDDRYTFPDAIESVKTISVTSKQAGTNTPDTEVIRKKSALDRDVGIACGVGTATVTLKNGDVYEVTVEKAPISVFLIIGQSNAEGSTIGEDPLVYGKALNQSIVCEPGQVYTTYAWSTTGHAKSVAGINSSKWLSVGNASSFVAKSLTSDTSRNGSALEYPLNSFTAGNIGKVGFDSGLAWNWNRITGEKVWVVNCSAGSSGIEAWQPDFVPATGETTPARMNRYKMCLAVMQNVKATMDEEVAAGHYELNHFSYFWLQGETNKNSTAGDYRAKLDILHRSLKKDVVMTGNKQLEACGIILVRAFETTNPAIDTVDNGPRIAQKAFVAQTEDAFMACDVNDQWISASGVTNYWNTVYPQSKYPFTVHSQAYENPTQIATVHTGIHYLQPGYNEIGIVSAKSAVDYITSGKQPESLAYSYADMNWGKGNTTTSDGLWKYEWFARETETFAPMTWNGTGSYYEAPFETADASDPHWYCRIRSHGTNMHPGAQADATITFIAPEAGAIRYTVNITRQVVPTPDGNTIRVMVNDKIIPIQGAEDYLLNDANTLSLDLTINVEKGDLVRLMIGSQGNSSSDGVNFSGLKVQYLSEE